MSELERTRPSTAERTLEPPPSPVEQVSVAGALSEDAARECVNQWAQRGYFRLRNMGDKIFVDQLVPTEAYTIRLQTQYEERSVAPAESPYLGGPIDDRRATLGAWQIAVPPAAPFAERVDRVTMPGTERVHTCNDCAGEGRVACRSCGGNGQVVCMMCGGTGMRHQHVREPGNNAQMRTIAVRCSCGDGRVRCGACGGSGVQTCGRCSGSGQVKSFEQLTVRFRVAKCDELIDLTPVPDHWMSRLSGDLLVDRHEQTVNHVAAVVPAVDEKVRVLLDKAHAVDPQGARILTEALRVERIPLVEMRYKYAGVERQLWLAGKEHEVYAPHAPWHRKRMMLLITAGVTIVAAAAGALAYYFLMGG